MKNGSQKSKIDTSGIHLWLVLWKASRSLEAHAVRHIAALDMCLSDFAVLEVLLHKGPLPVQEIAAKVLLTSGSMTAALDRLERRGLIERKEDEHDRRIRVVRLTASGKVVMRPAFAEHTRAMEQAVAGIGRADREILIELLRNVGRNAEARLKSVAAKSGGKRNGEE